MGDYPIVSSRGSFLAAADRCGKEHSDLLDALDPGVYAFRVVEQLSEVFDVHKQVTFLADLLAEANAAGLSIAPVRV